MQAFQPKHYNNTFINTFHNTFRKFTKDGIYITSDSRIIITKHLKYNLMKYIGYGEFYVILRGKDILTYDDLTLIDNAISVCIMFGDFIVLLSTGELVFITCNASKLHNLQEIIDSIHIDYICNDKERVLFLACNTLHVLNDNYTLSVYENIIGYIAKNNITLILFSDYRIEYICITKLYKILNDSFVSMSSEDDMLTKEEQRILYSISINDNQIYFIFSDKVVCYCRKEYNTFYNEIKDFTNIKDIFFIHNMSFCLLEYNTLIYVNTLIDSNDKNIFKFCLNVTRYLECLDLLVCFHSDDSLDVIECREERGMAPITAEYEQNEVISFLKKPSNFERVVSMQSILNYSKHNGNYYLMYINAIGVVEILDIMSLKIVSLDKLLSVERGIFGLNLMEYGHANYI